MTTEETILRETLAAYEIPEHMWDAAIFYVLHRRPPGQFLTALVSNDLAEAVGRADMSNQRAIVQWVRWFHNEAPSMCWGSPARVKEWIEQGQREREIQRSEVGREA